MSSTIFERRSTRLKEYDYSQPGYYFVTICTQKKQSLFGEISNNSMKLNELGKMVEAIWKQLPDRFPTIQLDEFVMMPNHMHAVIVLAAALNVGAPLAGALNSKDDFIQKSIHGAGARPAPTLGDVIGAFKSITSVAYIHGIEQQKWPALTKKIWQRNYYDHIIRNEEELLVKRQYILNNPKAWELDPENTHA